MESDSHEHSPTRQAVIELNRAIAQQEAKGEQKWLAPQEAAGRATAVRDAIRAALSEDMPDQDNPLWSCAVFGSYAVAMGEMESENTEPDMDQVLHNQSDLDFRLVMKGYESDNHGFVYRSFDEGVGG